MKAIMISIQPQWVEKILNGEKTIEIRKTKPKCELPCKVYIYCTKQKRINEFLTRSEKFGWIMARESVFCNRKKEWDANGKVVAEFTLNKVEKIKFDCPCSFRSFNLGFGFTENRYNIDITKTCLTEAELYDYLGEPFEVQGEYHQTFEFDGYAWHIDNLKIYDKPKELSAFNKTYPIKCGGHEVIDCYGCPTINTCNKRKTTRPPQSWCYVEELENEIT